MLTLNSTGHTPARPGAPLFTLARDATHKAAGPLYHRGGHHTRKCRCSIKGQYVGRGRGETSASRPDPLDANERQEGR